MTLSGDVLWLGPPAPWAAALGATVRTVETPAGLASGRDGAALAVLDAEHLGPLAAWLGRPEARPAALVLTERDDAGAEDAALRAGADEALPRDATEAEAVRAVRRAVARHAGVRGAAHADWFRLAVESATDVILVIDGAGRVVYASPSVVDQTGHRPEELEGTLAFDVVHPDDVDEVLAAIAEGVANPGTSRSLRYRVRTKTGSVRSLEGAGRMVIGDDGEPYGIIVVRDETDRREVEDQLAASEGRYRTLVQALPDVVSRIRTDGHVLDFHVPPVFETEFPAEALIGHRLQDKIPSDLAEKFEAAVSRVRETGRPTAYDYEVRVGGGTKHREVRLAPLGPDEVISMLRDVTALREHEAALEQSRTELRALAAHLQGVREEERAWLSREVHDVLGQQLTVIRLGVGWFGRRYPDDAEVQARLDDVRRTIDETLRHVRQIAADLRPGILDDFGLVSAVEWQAKRFEERSGLTCTVEVEDRGGEPSPEVATAAFRVFQEALTNVARHAEAEAVAVSLRLDPAAVCLTVTDDGRGMDPERAAERRTLGLLGMRERARTLGGTLDLRSGPGRGTVVEGTFPIHPPPPV